jgi:hypothetical protein
MRLTRPALWIKGASLLGLLCVTSASLAETCLSP